MKKSILNLKGAQELSKKEQKSINGGRIQCGRGYRNCPPGQCCSGNACFPYDTPGRLCNIPDDVL